MFLISLCPGRDAKCCDGRVCLSVFVPGTTRPNLAKFLRTLPVRWLYSRLSALYYVMNFRFCGWRHVFSQWAPRHRQHKQNVSSNYKLTHKGKHGFYIAMCSLTLTHQGQHRTRSRVYSSTALFVEPLLRGIMHNQTF